MIASIISVYRLILPGYRSRFYGFVAWSVAVGLLDMVGVASIMPLVAVMVDPAVLSKSQTAGKLAQLFGYGATAPPLHVVGMVMIVLFILANVASLALSWWSVRYSAQLSVALSRQVGRAHFRQPFTYFLEHSPAVLANQLCNEVAQFASNGILQLCYSLVRIVQISIVAMFMLWVAPGFTLVSLAVLGTLYAAVYRLSANRMAASGAAGTAASSQALHHATEMYAHARDILLRSNGGLFVDRVCDRLTMFYRADMVGRLLPSLPKYALEIIAVILVFALPIYRSLIGQDARAEMPLIATFAYAAFRLLPTVQQLYTSLSILKFYQPSAAKLHAILDGRALPAPDDARLAAMPATIEFRDVAHVYASAERPALTRANFSLSRGDRLAIVGPSGAGKSTLVDLLLGFLTPSSGRIVVDGRSVPNGLAWQANSVGYVPQTPLILTDTIASNIAFGCEVADIDLERCREAARKAGISHLIDEQKRGLAAVVGTDVQNFSGGERQRLAIARAMYARPSLLVLDEPASALDPPTAARLFDLLCSKELDATVVVITHDLDYLARFDKIVFMERGETVMTGSLDELLRQCPAFARFKGVLAAGDQNFVR